MTEGLSKEVAEFVADSWELGTKKMYNTYLKYWHTYALSKNVNLDKPKISSICGFLIDLYKNGYEYGSINAARCALSVMYPNYQDGQSVGKSYYVCRVLRAIALKRPPKPKYEEFWDVNLVFAKLQLWGEDTRMPLYRLSFKLATLMLIVSGERGQALVAMNRRQIVFREGLGVNIPLTKKMKNDRPGQKLRTIALKHFHTTKGLCVVCTLQVYLNRTRLYRKSDDLFVSYKTYKTVSRSTISRWVKYTLAASGVKTSYGAHTTRGASVSMGTKLQVPLNVLLKYGSWKGAKTMARHYSRPIETHNEKDLGQVLLENFKP